MNRQGNHRGTQYRTGIYYTNPEDQAIAKKVIDQEQAKYNKPKD